MKRFARLLIATVLTGPGCVALDTNHFGPKQVPPPAAKVPEAPPPPSVSAEQITDRNAAEMMGALRDELDYAARDHPAMPADVPSGKKP